MTGFKIKRMAFDKCTTDQAVFGSKQCRQMAINCNYCVLLCALIKTWSNAIKCHVYYLGLVVGNSGYSKTVTGLQGLIYGLRSATAKRTTSRRLITVGQ
jgi:hypothetical protein